MFYQAHGTYVHVDHDVVQGIIFYRELGNFYTNAGFYPSKGVYGITKLEHLG